MFLGGKTTELHLRQAEFEVLGRRQAGSDNTGLGLRDKVRDDDVDLGGTSIY